MYIVILAVEDFIFSSLFTSIMMSVRIYRSPRKGSQQLSQGAQGSEGMDWLPSDKDEGVMEKKSGDVPEIEVESESESDEEYESIATDPLVFSRVDVDTGEGWGW